MSSSFASILALSFVVVFASFVMVYQTSMINFVVTYNIVTMLSIGKRVWLEK